jgi:hypothetical protein
MNHFRNLRDDADGLDEPSAELLAARFGLTGITADNSFFGRNKHCTGFIEWV